MKVCQDGTSFSVLSPVLGVFGMVSFSFSLFTDILFVHTHEMHVSAIFPLNYSLPSVE